MPQQSDDEGFLSELDSNSSVLAITFGGLLMGVGMIPPFEFFNILSDSAPAKKVFVRDHYQAWYHHGVRNVANDVAGVSEALRVIIEECRPAKVVALGTSAGGYASLLFGRLLGVDSVHAFSPQTFISPMLRKRYCDRRWGRRWSALMESGRYEPRYGDLAEFFDATPCERTRFVIHYGYGDELGSVHAERLASSSPDVELRRYDIPEKAVIRHLRQQGELKPLLRDILVG